MRSSDFSFSDSNGATITGKLELPETTPRGWAIFAHCFTCGQNNRAATLVSRALSRNGIGVLRFDFAGSGLEKAARPELNFGSDIEDIQAAIRAMGDAGMAPSLLIGHSFGGSAAILAARQMPSITAVATIGAPSQPEHVLQNVAPQDIETIKNEGEASVEIAGRTFLIRSSFLTAVSEVDLEAAVAALRKPILVMHAPLDQVVGIEHASLIFHAARHPKSFVSLDSADHFLTNVADASYAAGIIAAWASRFLPKLEGDLPQIAPANGVYASETLHGRLQVSIRSGEHRLLADEPPSVGGGGTGLSPYELVSAGLAACTIMTMRLYAERKGFPLERATIAIEHQKVPHMRPADRFIRTIGLEGPMNAEQRASILAIADRCPVDLTLVRGADVQTSLLESINEGH